MGTKSKILLCFFYNYLFIALSIHILFFHPSNAHVIWQEFNQDVSVILILFSIYILYQTLFMYKVSKITYFIANLFGLGEKNLLVIFLVLEI